MGKTTASLKLIMLCCAVVTNSRKELIGTPKWWQQGSGKRGVLLPKFSFRSFPTWSYCPPNMTVGTTVPSLISDLRHNVEIFSWKNGSISLNWNYQHETLRTGNTIYFIGTSAQIVRIIFRRDAENKLNIFSSRISASSKRFYIESAVFKVCNTSGK